MFTNIEVVNKLKIVEKVSLKNLVLNNFSKDNGKFFYSIETTAKSGFKLDFNDFKTLPLFADITWIKNDNLKAKKLLEAPAFDLGRKITSSQVVNSVTCYTLTDDNLDEILRDSDLKNFNILRGDIVDGNQKFMYANELIAELHRKTRDSQRDLTVLAGGYPEVHIESRSQDEDLMNLKRKVESGVDIILTQVVFSSEKFISFVKKCREVGISSHVPIIPGLYIPFSFKELNLILKITKVSIDPELYQNLEALKDNAEEFQKVSLTFMTKTIKNIQENSSEFIRGFHFFTLNNFKMIQKLIEIIDFSEE